jgi:hypothetical protein
VSRTRSEAFSVEAVEANRDGRLSNDQQRRLGRYVRRRRRRDYVWAASALAIAALVVAVRGQNTVSAQARIGVVVFLVATAIGRLIFGSRWRSRGYAADVRAGKVLSDVGRITRSSDPHTLMMHISVDGRRYGPVTRTQWAAAGPVTSGRLYYLPRTKAVVNLEADTAAP